MSSIWVLVKLKQVSVVKIYHDVLYQQQLLNILLKWILLSKINLEPLILNQRLATLLVTVLLPLKRLMIFIIQSKEVLL